MQITPTDKLAAYKIKTFVILNSLGKVKENGKVVSLEKKIERQLPNKKKAIYEKKITNFHV